MNFAGHLTAAYNTYNAASCAVDETGLGAGVVDRLKELGVKTIGINYSARARDADKYYNTATELWGDLADALHNDEIGPLRQNTILTAQLIARQYYYLDNKICIEAKETLRKRGLKSPDRADALTLAWRAHLVTTGRHRHGFMVVTDPHPLNYDLPWQSWLPK
jgi:hypothetical protein